MIKKIIAYILDNYVVPNSRSVRNYISNHSSQFGHYIMVPVAANVTINQVLGEYRFYDIRRDDIVLDIGANVGGFSMLICNNVKHVFAVEPLFMDILKQNITHNHIKNITIFNIGLGLNRVHCKFMSRAGIVECRPLSKIIQMCGGTVDFLKCDCEGGEWNINADELKGIRRIEMELHMFNGDNKNDFTKILTDAGFEYEIDSESKTTLMIHATNRNVS